MYIPVQGSSDPYTLYQEAQTLYQEADKLRQAERYAESVEKIEQALEIYPDYPQAYILKGVSLLGQEKFNESLIPLKTAIDFYTNDTYLSGLPGYKGESQDKGIPYFWYAVALFDLERYNESSEMYSKAIEAYENYGNALDSEPVTISAHTLNGETEYEVAYPDGTIGPRDDQFAEAIDAAKSRTLLRLADTYYNKGLSLYLMGLKDDSLQYYDKAKKLNQNLEPYSSD